MRATAGRALLLIAAAALAACSPGAVPTHPAPSSTGTVDPSSPSAASTGGGGGGGGGGGSSTSPAGRASTATGGGSPAPRSGSAGTGRSISATSLLRPPLRLQAAGRLAHEGQFRAVVSAAGSPVVQVAYLRADGAHGSAEAGVVWISQQATRWELHPGWADPGRLSDWNQPDTVAVAERPSLLVTFNGGFKTPELRGGFYENGRLAGALLPGAASVVIYQNGHAALGSWGTEVQMTPQVVAVRQNLTMLIDHGVITHGLSSNVGPDWGSTGQGPAVWRSGLGITATGDLVFVMGALLTPQTLANLLLAAGAERAMEMDINPTWMSFMWYTPGQPTDVPTPHKLLNFQRPANRYLGTVSRDFFAVYLR